MSISQIVVSTLWAASTALALTRAVLWMHSTNDHGRVGMGLAIGDRQAQEDSVEVLRSRDGGILAVLADGRGINHGGKRVGQVTIRVFRDIFQADNAFMNPQYFFKKAFRLANNAVMDRMESENKGSASVGSVLIRGSMLSYALVGNVKIALFRGMDMSPISRGHTISTLAQQRYREGKLSARDARELMEDARVYHFLGQDDFRAPEVCEVPIRLNPRDIVVMMSDGVYDCLTWREIEGVLQSRKNCKEMAAEIEERVKHSVKQDKDNASVILIRI